MCGGRQLAPGSTMGGGTTRMQTSGALVGAVTRKDSSSGILSQSFAIGMGRQIA